MSSQYIIVIIAIGWIWSRYSGQHYKHSITVIYDELWCTDWKIVFITITIIIDDRRVAVFSQMPLMLEEAPLYHFPIYKKGQSRPLFVYFRSFHIPIQMTNIQFEQYKLKKHRWCAWDSNPRWQYGSRRQIHWAIAAPPISPFICFPLYFISLSLSAFWFFRARSIWGESQNLDTDI